MISVARRAGVWLCQSGCGNSFGLAAEFALIRAAVIFSRRKAGVDGTWARGR
jgi:hypothetical protein